MNITKRYLERLIRNAFEAGVFAGQDSDRPRDVVTSRAAYVRDEMERLFPPKRWREFEEIVWGKRIPRSGPL